MTVEELLDKSNLPARYRLEVVVADDTTHTVVLMFNDTGTELLKCSAESLMGAEDDGEDADDDSNLPTAIRNLIALTADDAVPSMKRLSRHPTMCTPIKPNEEKKKRVSTSLIAT
nr:hypothetical protein [Tanacetum cinerariifolium]